MDTNIKISLSIALPGSVLFSKESSFKNGKPDPEKHHKEFMKIEDGKGHFETITVNTRKCIPAKQIINISEEAYNYFISDEKPSDYRNDWKSMSIQARLYWHLSEIAKSRGGKMISYQVLE